jgi:hypothetical protein
MEIDGKALRVHGAKVPLDWLVRKHDPERFPASTLSTPQQKRQAQRDVSWSRQRDQYIAAAAAGIHVALFSFNLAFWGFEGMPQDRYNPSNIRFVCFMFCLIMDVDGGQLTSEPLEQIKTWHSARSIWKHGWDETGVL